MAEMQESDVIHGDMCPIPGHDHDYARAGWREAIRLRAQEAQRLARENERLREALREIILTASTIGEAAALAHLALEGEDKRHICDSFRERDPK